MLGKLIEAIRRAFRRTPGPKRREWFLYLGDGAGVDMIGAIIREDGRTGRVVDGTILKILVEWD